MSETARRVIVREVLSSRYPPGMRPVTWEGRSAGSEKILTNDQQTLVLYSDGGQSSPAPGWELFLTRERLLEDGTKAFEWTLYGIAPQAEASEVGGKSSQM